MRFVITVEDVVLFGLLAVGVVLMGVGIAISRIEKIKEKMVGKKKQRQTERSSK